MNNVIVKRVSKVLTVFVTLVVSGSVVAATVDSTAIGLGKRDVTPHAQPYLLAQGSNKVGDGAGSNNANIHTTNKRCPVNMHASLNTSVKSIQRFGEYGILGIANSLVLNTYNYRIYGKVDAPAGGGINPNYVVISWQVWCMGNQA